MAETPEFEYIQVLTYLYPEVQAYAAGPLYEDIVWVDPNNTVAKEVLTAGYITMRKRMLAEEINVEVERRLDEGVIFNGHLFSTDMASRLNLVGAIVGTTMLNRPVPEGFSWRSADNTDVPMDQTELTAFGMLVVDYNFALHKTAWAKKAQIFDSSITTVEQLDALDTLNTGWPPQDMIFPPPEEPEEPPPEEP